MLCWKIKKGREIQIISAKPQKFLSLEKMIRATRVAKQAHAFKH